jgi:riboflavin kinase/FMN adenylyltransferase
MQKKFQQYMKHFANSLVKKGKQLGRKLGFPTANIEIDSRLDITNGVYAAVVSVGEKKFGAVANIGIKPTVENAGRTLEAHIFDFPLNPGEELYGRTISVELVEPMIRPERKFASLDELRIQIADDCRRAREILSGQRAGLM